MNKNTKICPNCKKEISNEVCTCPHCKANIPTDSDWFLRLQEVPEKIESKTGNKGGWLFFFGLGTIILALFNSAWAVLYGICFILFFFLPNSSYILTSKRLLQITKTGILIINIAQIEALVHRGGFISLFTPTMVVYKTNDNKIKSILIGVPLKVRGKLSILCANTNPNFKFIKTKAKNFLTVVKQIQDKQA